MLGKIEGRKKRGQQRMRWLDSPRRDGHEFESDLGVGDGQAAWVLQFMMLQSWTRLSD